MDINGISAVVTGAASGLGEATARALAAKGAKVAIFDRDTAKGEAVAAELGGIFCEVDVTSDEKVAAAFARARAAHGQERILVNCAGVANAAKTVARDKETKARELGRPQREDRLQPVERALPMPRQLWPVGGDRNSVIRVSVTRMTAPISAVTPSSQWNTKQIAR